MLLYGKRVYLPLLTTEMAVAGVVVNGLGTYGDDLHTYTVEGALIDVPPGARPVIDAHVAPPLVVDYVASISVEAVVRTTDATPLVVFRFPTTLKHVYKAMLEMMAVDATSGATRNTEARMTFKRTPTGLVQVGATAISYNAADTATTGWVITPSVDGTDLVISVTGTAGRTVDWTLLGTIGTYAPEGLT